MSRERPLVREESHLDDMRAAIRADFERLEERRGEQVLLRPREQADQSEATPIEDPHPTSEESDVREETLDPSPNRSWIDRLLGL